ncbi:MAG: hypothetical protein SFV17_05715 [Candidatus Obscuribacter sp.]|nr:hypothetical protein [Candidatus Obscuribacter sp.]
MLSLWKMSLPLLWAMALMLSLAPKGWSLSPSEVNANAPAPEVLTALPRAKVGAPYIDGLKQAASFKDYQVECQLFTTSGNAWKSFGSADLSYKQTDLLRAEIKSSDYRNGSVVVKQADGSVRGRGGGMLRALTMNLDPNARSIRLPTGYSLASSDFLSLLSAVRNSITRGASASATNSTVNLKLFKQPVLVLLIENGGKNEISEAVFLHHATRVPVGWGTYRDGKPSALVFFEGLTQNKGLSEDLFHL